MNTRQYGSATRQANRDRTPTFTCGMTDVSRIRPTIDGRVIVTTILLIATSLIALTELVRGAL